VIKIKKMKFRALVDSGAEVSLIHSRIFASLKYKQNQLNYLHIVVIYSYHGLPYDKSVLVSLMTKSPSTKFALSTSGMFKRQTKGI
jgi:hypothetical protein